MRADGRLTESGNIMLNDRRLRRNDVVAEREADGGWSPYGRVWRRHDRDHVEVVDCMKHVTVYHEDELRLVIGYQGYWTLGDPVEGVSPCAPSMRINQRLIRMASLRKLKRMASRYQPHFGGTRKHTDEERREALANPNRYMPPSKRVPEVFDRDAHHMPEDETQAA